MTKIKEKHQEVRENEEDWEEFIESESKIIRLLSIKNLICELLGIRRPRGWQRFATMGA